MYRVVVVIAMGALGALCRSPYALTASVIPLSTWMQFAIHMRLTGIHLLHLWPFCAVYSHVLTPQ